MGKGNGMDRMAVLVVEDEETVRTYLAEFLASSGYLARTASHGAQALEMLKEGSFDAVLLDVLMPGLTGLEVLKQYRASGGAAPVIVLSALSGADDAVRAMKLGATDYLPKPFGNEELEDALGRALGTRAPPRHPVPVLEEANAEQVEDGPAISEATPRVPRSLARPANASHAFEAEERNEVRQLISASPSMARVRALIDRISDTDVPVLLLGESGTGKEVIAREIHQRSRRRGKPFIKINCAALPAELLESELFGHERGAFTGATAEKPGKFELADQGTIFLDEIGEMAIRLQAKLLQVLQDEEFFRVGGKRSVRVDSRVVVATNRELEKEIAAGNFREDLFYRLNVVAIRLPALRDRKEDIVPLVDHFLRKYGRKYRNATAELPAEVLRAFADYDWPGNVRELENMVRRLVVLKDPHLVLDELRAANRSPASAPSLPTAYGGGDLGVPVHAREQEVTFAPPVPAPVNFLTPTAAPLPHYANPFTTPQPPPPALTKPESEMSLKEIGKRASMLAEREAILVMLQRTAWNKRKAATKLRISYKALLYKIKETGIIDPRANAEF